MPRVTTKSNPQLMRRFIVRALHAGYLNEFTAAYRFYGKDG
jgi:hypothetical protein